MSTMALDPPSPAVVYDHPLRYLIPSRTNPHDSYVCELDSYSGNGECACPDFLIHFAPLLSRQITTEQALAQKLVKLRENQRPADALRCFHLVEARSQFADDVIHAMAKKEKHDDPPF